MIRKLKENRLLVTIVILILLILVITLISIKVRKSRMIEIDGSLSSSDPDFKIALEKQFSDGVELLNVVKEDEGQNNKDFVRTETENTLAIPYKKEDEDRPLGLLIMKKENNNWVEMQNIKLLGESFDEIRLKDMDNDGLEEIIIGTSANKKSTNSVKVFKLMDKVYVKVFDDSYEKMFIDDFDISLREGLVIVKKDPNNNSLTLNSFNFLKNNEVKNSEVKIGNIDDDISIKLSKLNSNRKGLIVQKMLDEKKGEINIYLVDDGKLLMTPINGKNSLINQYYIEVNDINEDKVADIPVLKQTYSGVSTDSSKPPYIIYWSTFDENFGLQTIFREYRSEENKFSFTIDNIWGENVDVKEKREEDSDKNIVYFDTFDENGNYKNKITIGIYSVQEWLRKIPNEFEARDNIIFKTEERVFLLESFSGEEGTDLKSVKSNFRVYNIDSFNRDK